MCAESAHLNVDEGGAPERVGGIKLLAVPAPDGKLTPELVESRIERIGDEHAIQPGVVSVTQSTELGTLYTPGELRALADHAHAHGMRLHVDGARLANAAAALGVELREITTDAGADVVSFGGTKAGLMLGEAIVLLGDGLEPALPYLRKQSMQLASKMRYVAAQFEALLTDELWRRAAGRANAMAARLAAALEGADGVRITQRVQANVVFARAPARRRRAPADRVGLLHVERAHRRGALDVLSRHARGGRRRVRRRDRRRHTHETCLTPFSHERAEARPDGRGGRGGRPRRGRDRRRAARASRTGTTTTSSSGSARARARTGSTAPRCRSRPAR